MTGLDVGHPDDVLDDVLRVDLADPQLYGGERPERIWATMRAAGAPLRMTGRREHWAVTRYDQVREVLRHSGALSSEKGQRLGEKPSDERAAAAAGGTSMLVTDDPAHAGMRRALESAFSPRAVRRLADGTAALARRLVADAVAAGPVDFVPAVATPLLTTVACDLLGIPESDRPRVAALTATAFSGSGHNDEAATAQLAAHTELLGYCDELLAHKRRHPGDDLATQLATATVDGRPLRRSAALMNCHDFVLGGNASARFVLTSIPMTLVAHRPFWARVRSGEVDVGTAVEELLRVEAPVNHVLRTLTADLSVGGAAMRRGEVVTLWLRSANRDADAFADPDAMLPGRDRPHLAFGHGIHHCIAARLARLEIAALVGALAGLVTDAELDGPPPRRTESNFLRGYRSVPIRLR